MISIKEDLDVTEKSITVIVPLTGNKDIVKNIRKQVSDRDELTFFHATSRNLQRLFNKTIVSSRNSRIFIANTLDPFVKDKKNKKLIDTVKCYDGTLVTNFGDGLSSKTSIVFDKKDWKTVDIQCGSISDYIKNMGIDFNYNSVVHIDDNIKEDKEQHIIKEKQDKEESVVDNNSKGVKVTDPPNIPIKNKKKPNNSQKLMDPPSLKNKSGKPTILFICDVKGWAWWIKSQYIKKYLSPYYDIDIINTFGDGNKIHKSHYSNYDLCFTYGYFFISKIKRVPKNKRITGITAHRPKSRIEPAMKMATAVHANSVLLFNELKQIHQNPFYVPNGVDTDLFYEKDSILSNDEMIFGHVGKKSSMKGQIDYIEPAVNKADVKYFSHYNNYKTRVPHTKMINIHHNYDVFVCASKEDGTPCPALEAAACGRPIISNKIGNMPELIDDTCGILLDKKDVDLYVDAIKWCKNNPDKVIEMGKNIQKKIKEEWTWELMAKNYMFMFDSILKIKRDDSSIYENPSMYHIK